MYYVLCGNDVYGEYETYEEAEKVCKQLCDKGEDAWIDSDLECDYYYDDVDECGFDPYEGCYTYDC